MEQIERAQAVYPVTSVPSELSLWTREWTVDVLPYCRTAVLPYCRTAVLPGTGHRLPAELTARQGRPHRPVRHLRTSCPSLGTKTPKYLTDNAVVADIRLSAAEPAALPVPQGDRY
ncbi:hypothetical protein OG235_14405 [Streptomyces sp. NBC_00024]